MTSKSIDENHKIDATTRFNLYPKIDIQEYEQLHNSRIIPTILKIDVADFFETMKKYDSYFKNWSNNRPDQIGIRQGLPLVNLTGRYTDDNDITIGPLDYYNKNNPDNRYNETDIRVFTKILYEKCFDPLQILHDYIIRSSILKWKKGANFFPHKDLQPPTPHLRLWGTTDPDNIKLRFENDQGELIEVENVEAGRIYIIDTAITHDAHCVNDIGYQFFIAVASEAYDIMERIKQ
tara:strand:+ start:2180 stop:2884 length:705 start_codon:yes stop_codon:yes gene_type:complete